MKEVDWADLVTLKINEMLINTKYSAFTGQKLIYSNEIIEYDEDKPSYAPLSYETDILIREQLDQGKWKPRVVIETKIDGVTTHDAITYSNKSRTHKSIHPYLRYGIFIGNQGNGHIPGRLIRHGENFDFMISWVGYEPNELELDALMDIINSEIKTSQVLDELVFNTRAKDRKRIFVLHRPLVIKHITNS